MKIGNNITRKCKVFHQYVWTYACSSRIFIHWKNHIIFICKIYKICKTCNIVTDNTRSSKRQHQYFLPVSKSHNFDALRAQNSHSYPFFLFPSIHGCCYQYYTELQLLYWILEKKKKKTVKENNFHFTNWYCVILIFHMILIQLKQK